MNNHGDSTQAHLIVRKAVMPDIPEIHSILSFYGEKGVLLPRPFSELYDHMRDYFVIEDSRMKPGIQAVGGLGICWEDLAEIKSLAVHEGFQGKGLGSRLVDACIQETKLFGIKKIFVLTYVPAFFARFGFREVSKSLLPQKIWADCLKCTKFPNCDEVAMLLTL